MMNRSMYGDEGFSDKPAAAVIRHSVRGCNEDIRGNGRGSHLHHTCLPEPDYVSPSFYTISGVPFYGFPGSCWRNLGKPVSFCIWTVDDLLMTPIPTNNTHEGNH